MSYHIRYSARFVDGLRDTVEYLRRQQVPEDWLVAWGEQLFEQLEHLQEWPRKGPADDRAPKDSGKEVRKLVYGKYIINYVVDDRRQAVEVISITHGSRRA